MFVCSSSIDSKTTCSVFNTSNINRFFQIIRDYLRLILSIGCYIYGGTHELDFGSRKSNIIFIYLNGCRSWLHII